MPDGVLVSRRVHGPFFDGAALLLDRVLSERWAVRHSSARDLVVDERVSAPLGLGLPVGRARLIVVLSGRQCISARSGRSYELGPGDIFFRTRIDMAKEFGDGERLEIDIDIDRGPDSLETVRLGARARDALGALAAAVRRVTPADIHPFIFALCEARAALAAEGIDLPVEHGGLRIDPAEQRVMTALDDVLSALGHGPALIDLESALTCDRRTVVRRMHRIHARHAIHGLRESTDFRSVRDFYRLLIGTILLSHRRATTEGVARALGYASPTALCHAFHRAGLASPQAVRARVVESR